MVRSLSDVAFAADAVILAGDISDDLRVLETTLGCSRASSRTPSTSRGTRPVDQAQGASGASSSALLPSIILSSTASCACATSAACTRARLLAPPPAASRRGSRAKRRACGSFRCWRGTTRASTRARRPRVGGPGAPARARHVRLQAVRVAQALDQHGLRRARDRRGERPAEPGLGRVPGRPALGERRDEADVLTFRTSSGLELCPEKRMLFYPNPPKAVGSTSPRAHQKPPVARRGARYSRKGVWAKAAGACARAHVHVGHFGWDPVEGVRRAGARLITRTSGSRGPGASPSGRTRGGGRST